MWLALAGETGERSGDPDYFSHSEIVQTRVHRYFLEIIQLLKKNSLQGNIAEFFFHSLE